MSIFSKRSVLSPAPGRGICPHLGLKEDPQTCLAYPSEWNLCHHARPAAVVSFEQQRTTCLLPKHTACPVYQREQLVSLPAHLRGRRASLRSKKWILLLLFLILALGFGLWVTWRSDSGLALYLNNNTSIKVVQPEPPMEINASVTSALLEIPEATPAAFETILLPPGTSTHPSALPASLKSCGHELEDRIYLGQQILTLHRVAYGENMDLLAANYETSLSAIQSLNYFLPSPLWVDLVIVIPVGSPDISGLPFFEPYFILDSVASLDVIAQQVSVTRSDLVKYNDLDANCPAYAGWLLVPHPAKKSP